MSEVKITDLVDQKTIDQIKNLDAELKTLLQTYTSVATDLAKGVDVPVKSLADVERLERLLAEKTREATEATTKLNEVLSQQSQIVANTTNTSARFLMEQERINKANREAFTEHERVKKLLEQFHDTYEGQIQRLVRVNAELVKNKKAQSDNDKALKDGKRTIVEYNAIQADLIAQQRQLQQEKRSLNQILTAEEKAMQSDATAYTHMSQQLELLKKAYKELSAEGRDSDYGKELETTIQNLDAHLKDLGADMGEHQRNVGNYAIACQNGVVTTESLSQVLGQEAVTLQELKDQTKILEEAKLHLNTADANYAEQLSLINAKIEENKKKLTDVSDILGKQPDTVAEAEEQNKRFAEALRNIDLSADGAKEQIKLINEKIEANSKIIKDNTKSLQEQKKENVGLADQMLNMIGINSNFASSLSGIKANGDVWSGIGTKVKAFGKTLTGLLANPWVLAFLGIGGVIAGVKWWYDYNKGLLEATKLTKNFTHMAGDDMRDVRSNVQVLADEMGQGFDKTISAANILVNQFGISWNEALDDMKGGLLAGANMHGRMLENIEKYSGAFRDAGISAKEFMAVLVNTKDGLFDENALKAITEAGMRIRNMSDKTKMALEQIGISSEKMQNELADGSLTMVGAVQQVTDKLKDISPNSQEAGAAMVNIFGKKSARAGEEVAKSISDIEINLDALTGKMSEAKKIDSERMEVQKELNDLLAAMFDNTDGGFQKMIANMKLISTKWLLAIIKGCLDIGNWFVRLYNNSLLVRAGVEGISLNFKNMWRFVKLIFKQIIDSCKSFGEIIEGVFTLDWDKVQSGYANGLKALGNNIKDFAKEAAADYRTAMNNIMNGSMKEYSLPKLHTTGAADEAAGQRATGAAEGTGYEDPKDIEKRRKAEEKKRKAAEKAAQDALKVLNDLEESKIALMAEGHEKEIALLKLSYKKKIDAIKGHSANEEALRLQLATEMNNAVAKADEEYYREMAKINLDNRLASVKEGSKEELDLKMAMLQAEYDAEVRAAAKTGADVNLIKSKYDKEATDLKENYANKQSSLIAQNYANEASQRDAALTLAEAKENEAYAEKLKGAKGNATEMERLKTEHEDNLLKIQEDYARKSADAAIEMLEKQLAVEDLTAEEREQLENALAKAKADKEKLMADQAIEQMNRTAEEDTKLKEKRIANAQMWMQTAADALNNVNELAQAIFDGKIQKIEEEQEANTAASEAEQNRISELAEKKVITEEEAEARKRAAQAKSEQKNAELEAKKQKLKEKQAKWDRANAIAQCGIQTALAIMNALQMQPFPVGIAMAAIAGAMGAVQLATILATPIPKYAKGTDYHKGGPAIVGDGGRQEVVVFNNRAWLTPDKPTVVDLPAGASVIPSVEMLTNDIVGGVGVMNPSVQMVTLAGEPNVIVKNNNNTDTRRLEERLDNLANLIKQQTKIQRDIAYDREYEIFKASRI